MTDIAGGADANYIVATPDPDERPLVGVGFPSPEYVPAGTAFSNHCLGNHTKAVRLLPLVMMGQDPAQARNQMAAHFLANGCTAIVFIDQDMIYPPNSIDRLWGHLAAHDNIDIVGADYRKRAAPFGRVGWPLEGVPDPEHGLVERVALGLGLLMIRRKVFERMERPWFARVYDGKVDNGQGVMTEDYYFALKAKDPEHGGGFTTWCDIDLTREVMHIGMQPVPWVIPGIVEQPPPGKLVKTSEAA